MSKKNNQNILLGKANLSKSQESSESQQKQVVLNMEVLGNMLREPFSLKQAENQNQGKN